MSCNNHSHEHEHNHSHEHSHDHCHCHDHDHSHEHDHCHCNEDGGHHLEDSDLSKDEKTLGVLLVHWINHNKTHQEGFLEWVEKANNMDKPEVANSIKKAVEFMDKANEMLIEAKKYM